MNKLLRDELMARMVINEPGGASRWPQMVATGMRVRDEQARR
jgi:hypothetical protein